MLTGDRHADVEEQSQVSYSSLTSLLPNCRIKAKRT